MHYRRITLPIRYQLQALHEAGHTRVTIGHQLGFSHTTISRELKRVTPYNAELAHQHAENEQKRRHLPRIPASLWDDITQKLRLFSSPEQIKGRCKRDGQTCPSIESIYRYVYKHPELIQCLRQGRPARRNRHSKRHNSALWTSITERPEEANERRTIGHLEADLLEGAKGKGSLVVIEDRCSRFVTLNLLATKAALEVFSAMDAVLDGQKVKSITIDQGREFVLTEALGQQWNAKTYACHAHSPWEPPSADELCYEARSKGG